LYSDNDKFDVVITDMRMSEMSGIELLRQIIELDNNARIIMATAFNDLETQNKAKIYKPYAFLVKPFKLADLISILNKIEQEIKAGKKIKMK
jgi:two-component system response regulator YesN